MKKKKKQTPMFRPNLIDSKEVQYIKQQHPNADIPSAIPYHNKEYYNFMSLKLVRTGGIGYQLKVRVFTMDQFQFDGMDDNAKKSIVGKYDQLVIIHDPTLEEEEEEEAVEVVVVKKSKTGRLTDAKEKKILKAFQAYIDKQEGEEIVVSEEFIEELSEKHNVPADKIAELLSSLSED
jgi:hypothetical protein